MLSYVKRGDKVKNIQISEELFNMLLDYFFGELSPTDFQSDIIRQQLDDKLDKLIAREIFTRYKRALTPAEREKYRKEYLKHIGISSSFISEIEVNYKEC